MRFHPTRKECPCHQCMQCKGPCACGQPHCVTWTQPGALQCIQPRIHRWQELLFAPHCGCHHHTRVPPCIVRKRSPGGSERLKLIISLQYQHTHAQAQGATTFEACSCASLAGVNTRREPPRALASCKCSLLQCQCACWQGMQRWRHAPEDLPSSPSAP